ncbi:MAG: SusC/RagA family TonB-linked outer membrane protein [Cyclobacteriaceae bacterium]
MNKVSIWLVLQLVGLSIYAQTLQVSGIVSDQNHQPIPGVSIQEKGSQIGTITDQNGSFQLETNANAILVLRFVGFETREYNVAGQTSVSIELKEDVLIHSPIVVTALGIERQTRDLGYNVQRIEAEDVSQVKSSNFVDNLAGRLAGVTVSQGATGVGSTSKITIRGEASFTNNNPLFVVDGIPINNNTVLNFTNEAASGFQEVDFGNGAMEVNADDIETVSVLKGPSAAALYGTRASNGAIIITLKDGSRKRGMGISFNTSTFIDQAFQLPEFQNAYGQGNSGQFEFTDGLGRGTNDNITYSWGPALDQGISIPQFDSPVTLANGTVVRGGDVAVHGGLPITGTPFNSNPDNLKDFYKTGITTINNLSVSSQFENGSSRLSFTDLRSESIIPGVNLDRQTLTAKLRFRPSEKITVRSSLSYIHSESDNRPSGGYGSENINYSLVAWGPRSLDINALKSYWQPGLEGVQQYSFNYTFFDNPYFILKENTNSFNRNRVFGNISASYLFTDNLSLTLRTGMDLSSEERQFKRAFSTNRFRNGAYAVHDVIFRENNTDLLLNFTESVSSFDFDISVGANRMDQRASTIQTQALSLAQPGIFRLSNAASPLEVFDFLNEKRINSLYALAKVSYRNFLYFEATARNDWSSALATTTSTENTSFFYPSVSAAFVLTEVLDAPDFVDFFKLRASWAQVGNDTNPYQTNGVFNSSTPYNGEPTLTEQASIPNSNLLPEKTSSIELGLETWFFNNKIRMDFTYYNALTQNQIISLPVSITSGYTQRVVNGGEVRSKGVEIILGATILETSKLRWNTQLNFSRNITSVETLTDEVDRLTLGYSRVYDNVNQTVFFQVEEGGRIGDIYGTGYLRNENGDFVINENGLYIADNSLKKLGNYNPDFILGFSNNIQYHNWNLDFLFDWRYGGILVSRTRALATVAGQLKETANRPEGGIVAPGVVISGGTSDNPTYSPNTTAISAEQYYRNFYDRNHEENNTYDASYLKLRELSLGYTFTKGFLGENSSLNIAFIGRNLFAISEIPHFDPEQLAVQGNQFVSGVEDMSYATTRSYGVKIGLNF